MDGARAVLGTHWSWVIFHVRKEANSAAHHLARFALSCSIEQIWMEEVPRCIYDIALLEQFTLTV